MNKEITISPRQIAKAIEDLLDEKELLQDKIYKMEERINKAIEFIKTEYNTFPSAEEWRKALLEILKDEN